MKIYLLIFNLFILLLTFVNAQRQEQCAISGRVVDDYGKPVVNSYLHWYPKYDGGIHFNTYHGKSGEDGNFEHRESCSIGSLTLYVTSSLTQKNYTPILPPFVYGSKLGKQVKGLPIVKNENGDLALGDVKVQVYYSTVTIRFVDESSENLFTEKSDWENAIIRLRDEKRKIFSEENLSLDQIKKAVRVENSAIVMDLPEGDWKIEIRPNKDKKIWLKPDKLVSVKRSENRSEISLTMLLKK